MKLEGAIFDLDGTLLDTMPFWDRLGGDYLEYKGIQPPADINAVLRTMSLEQAARYLKVELSLPGTEKEIIREIVALIESKYRLEVPLKPGALALLQSLAVNGVRMCVATAADRELAQAALTRLGVARYFQFIYTCSEAGRGKDNPEFFRQVLAKLQTPPEKTVVFEDALHAIRSAKEAGLLVAAVYDPSSHREWEEIKAVANYYLHSFADWKVIQ
ncbi:MAG: HAD family phosphatase [Clostridia bacterium]|nr:HAD family phosphatase [Clostridia bacterium]